MAGRGEQMEIQKTEIYESGRWVVKHKPDGHWKLYLKMEKNMGIVGELWFDEEDFEVLVEILRSIG
jgi:hypothetical protein